MYKHLTRSDILVDRIHGGGDSLRTNEFRIMRVNEIQNQRSWPSGNGILGMIFDGLLVVFGSNKQIGVNFDHFFKVPDSVSFL